VIKRERKGVKQEEGELPRRPSMSARCLVALPTVLTKVLIRIQQRRTSTELLDLLPLITNWKHGGHDVTHIFLCLFLSHNSYIPFSLTHTES